jgi:transposase-like protein
MRHDCPDCLRKNAFKEVFDDFIYSYQCTSCGYESPRFLTEELAKTFLIDMAEEAIEAEMDEVTTEIKYEEWKRDIIVDDIKCFSNILEELKIKLENIRRGKLNK